jgi:hypothetical protein
VDLLGYYLSSVTISIIGRITILATSISISTGNPIVGARHINAIFRLPIPQFANPTGTSTSQTRTIGGMTNTMSVSQSTYCAFHSKYKPIFISNCGRMYATNGDRILSPITVSPLR